MGPRNIVWLRSKLDPNHVGTHVKTVLYIFGGVFADDRIPYGKIKYLSAPGPVVSLVLEASHGCGRWVGSPSSDGATEFCTACEVAAGRSVLCWRQPVCLQITLSASCCLAVIIGACAMLRHSKLLCIADAKTS